MTDLFKERENTLLRVYNIMNLLWFIIDYLGINTAYIAYFGSTGAQWWKQTKGFLCGQKILN